MVVSDLRFEIYYSSNYVWHNICCDSIGHGLASVHLLAEDPDFWRSHNVHKSEVSTYLLGSSHNMHESADMIMTHTGTLS